ncbi:MAG TPA: acyltransferase [Vicinamibacterales bacterium]|nr:acyltransferase [Vicinamibacterales bacterium]
MATPAPPQAPHAAGPPGAPAWQAAPRIPALDGVRGLAILLVILFHHTLMRQETVVDQVYVNLARLGWSGVDLFFVLSGFLITGLLVDSKGGSHYYRNFYIRRTLRIFPLYYAFLVYVLWVCPWLWPDTQLAAMSRDAMAGRSEAWYWLYLPNVLFARDETFGHPNLAVTWSLAIEEQFYLLWPLVVALTSRRALAWTCGGLIVAAFALRTWLVLEEAHWIVPYVLPMCRMDALAAGALVALALRADGGGAPAASARLLARARIVAIGAAVVVLAIWYIEDPLDNADWSEPLMQTVGYTTIALGYAAVVALAAGGQAGSWLVRVFSASALQTLGRYSYALYLFHVPIRRFIRDEYFPVDAFPTWLGSPLPGQLLFYVAATAPALALAWLSWHVYERRWLALARHFPYARRPAGPA